MLKKFVTFSQSVQYWVLLIVIGLAAEGLALFYQYKLDIRPCVLCIHVRIWVLGFIIVAGLAILVKHSRNLILVAHIINTAIMAGLLERSYQLLSIERGWAFGSCDFDLGLPQWLALEEWFPTMFKVWESCGYTPELVFGITMAEALILMSGSLLLISLSMLAVSANLFKVTRLPK